MWPSASRPRHGSASTPLSKLSIAHCRIAPVMRYMLGCRKQNSFQTSSKAVDTDTGVVQIVRQRAPDRRAYHRKSLAAVSVESVAGYDKTATGAAKMS